MTLTQLLHRAVIEFGDAVVEVTLQQTISRIWPVYHLFVAGANDTTYRLVAVVENPGQYIVQFERAQSADPSDWARLKAATRFQEAA